MPLTTDRNDPRLGHGSDDKPAPQSAAYLVLSEDERAKGFIRPVSPATGRFWTQAQLDNIGKGCGTVTSMGQAIAETYARNPGFYGSTYCVHCSKHLPVSEFVWVDDGLIVGS